MAVTIYTGRTKMVKFPPLFKTGKEDIQGDVRCWAERGMIHMSWEQKDGEHYDAIPIREALVRLRAVNEALGATPRGAQTFYNDQINILQTFVEDMGALIKEALHQGDPLDPQVTATKADQRSKPVFLGSSTASATGGSPRVEHNVPQDYSGKGKPRGTVIRRSDFR